MANRSLRRPALARAPGPSLAHSDGHPRGILHTRGIDLAVMSQGEALREGAALAYAVAANEATKAAGVFAALCRITSVCSATRRRTMPRLTAGCGDDGRAARTQVKEPT